MIIKVENITKIYTLNDGLQENALRDVTMEVAEGGFVSIVGASGSGKTTLMNILGCLDKPSSGKYWLNGADITTLSKQKLHSIRNNTIGFVFQEFNLIPRRNLIDNISMPLMYRGIKKNIRHKKACDMLNLVGLKSLGTRFPNQLSGGQRQRVAIARALINNPKIVLADEPTGNLDSKTGDQILNLFETLNKQNNITVILITHDHHVANKAKKIIKLSDGQIINITDKANHNN